MKSILILVAGTAVAVSNVSAATTLQFSKAPVGATNFANSAGVATNGMLWGVVVDTSGDGFDSGSYESFSSAASGFMSAGGGASDDYYVFTGTSTSSLSGPFFAGVEAGAGGITTANNVPSTGDGVAGVAAGKAFALIWFESSSAADGDKYGVFTSPSFVLPASGVVDFSAAFSGADPARAASNTFGGALAPEPSRMMLALFGIGLVGLRRRR